MPGHGQGAVADRPLISEARADAVDALARCQADGLISGGKVAVVSMTAVVERDPARWPARRELAMDYLGRELRRSVGADAALVSVSDTDFLVVQPGVPAIVGQLTCIGCLRQTLQHFLGDASVGDLRVHVVTHVEPDGVFGERLDVVAVETAAASAAQDRAAPAKPSAWSPFVTSSGQQVRVSCSLEPVLELKGYSRIGYRLARRVLAQPSDRSLTEAESRRLSAADLERIDFATIARGLDRLSSGGGVRAPSLIAPICYSTLASQRGRATLVELLKAAQAHVQHGLICEICDVEGVPQAALLAATQFIRPYSLYVLGRLKDLPCGVAGLKDVGVHALSAECPPRDMGDAEFSGWVRTFRAAAGRVSRAGVVYRVGSPRQAAIAALSGVTHASLRPANDPKEAPVHWL